MKKNKDKRKTVILVGFYLVVAFMLLYYSVGRNTVSVPVSLFSTASLDGEFNGQEKYAQGDTTPQADEKKEQEKENDGNQTEPSGTQNGDAQAETKSDGEQKQYSFITLNRFTILYVRREPSMQGEIIGRLAPGTTGDVIERGEEWSLITDGTITGYSFNQYLDMKEKK